MSRIISASLLLVLLMCPAFAQRSKSTHPLSDEQWQALLSALEKEDWSAAADYSLKYMKQLKDGDEENALPRLRYAFIFASAGKATEGKLAQKELEAILKDFIGKEVETPGRKIVADCKGGNDSMNAICFSSKSYDLTSAGTNNHGTSIFAFEYFRLQDKFDFPGHVGQWARVNAVVQSIDINPSILKLWVLRIFLEKARVTLEN